MPTKLLGSVAAATLLFGMTAAMAQSNEHNLVIAQNAQRGRQGPPAAAISRPAAPVQAAPRQATPVQAAPRIQAAPRQVAPSRQVTAPASRVGAGVQRQTTGQGGRSQFTGTTRAQTRQERTLHNAPVGRTTTGAGTANTRVEQNTNVRDQRNLGRRNVAVPAGAVVPPSPGRETTVSKPGAHATAALSAPQRTRLVQTIKESRDLNRVHRADFRVAVGSRVPRRLHLAHLPLAFFAIVPEYRGYDYVYVEDEDQIVIVEPDTLTVADVISASAERLAVTSGLALSTRERELIRRTALSERSTEGAAGDVDITVGTRIPDSITLLPFPDEVYAEIPQLSPLRFIVVHNEVLLVDTADRRIAYVID
jgi:hypothetical protein